MIYSTLKIAGVTVAGTVVLGGLVFGTELGSYASTSWNSMTTSIRDSVPLEIELQRARDLLDQIIPEMRANIRVIAEEEVELQGLSREIDKASVRLSDQRAGVEHLRSMLAVEHASYRVGNHHVSRDEVRSDLARRFALLQEAEASVEAKRRLFKGRQAALDAAISALEKTRVQKAELEAQIEALDAQHRLIQAASVGSGTSIDQSKIAQTNDLISQIRKRLDVAERTLAREGEFITDLTIEPAPRVDEASLLSEVDAYLGNDQLAVETQAAPDRGTATP
ncbi:hypothetical protein [Mucisphaera calidilacus]|uniref:Chromosome partition protein Smc n=1 Tax=Mucisphaera calidilacus TaxID=2527982 RepID=A0A518BWA6_9BACT|nr:hypothetical protein [Mucisphaera calidilacus]QDU71258.1 hypothetical protein Pan265_11070 [Mucisphaera calidilacus]